MKNIVIKISSNLINPENEVDIIEKYGCQLRTLKAEGNNIIIVTSGSVMYGLKKLNLSQRPDFLPLLQSCASIGQISLMWRYQTVFARFDLLPAQILLSADDFKVRKRYLNLRNTIQSLLSQNVIPIVNENDTINTDELKLGDNDHLSSLITIMMEFDLLIMLTDVAGVYNKDPKKHQSAELIRYMNEIDDRQIGSASRTSASLYSVGGMHKKLEAAQRATRAGIDVFIGNGYEVDLQKIVAGTEIGTYIKGRENVKGARKKWLAFSPPGNNSIYVDKGAFIALKEKRSSLLPSGVLDIKGNFDKGSLVSIYHENQKIAQGLSNYSSNDIKVIKGKKTGEIKNMINGDYYEEVIHKNNLHLFQG